MFSCVCWLVVVSPKKLLRTVSERPRVPNNHIVFLLEQWRRARRRVLVAGAGFLVRASVGFSCVPAPTHRYTQIHTDIHRFTQIRTDSHRYTQIHTDSHWFTQNHTDSQWFTVIHTDSHRFTQIHTDSHIFTHNPTYSHRFKPIHTDTRRFCAQVRHFRPPHRGRPRV